MIGKVKLRKTDRLYTQYLRERQYYICQRCGRVYTPDNCRNLVSSHFWGRGRESTRFDDENVDALCHLPCHVYWGHGEGRVEYQAFKEKQLTRTGYDRLMLRAHTYKARDDKMDEFIIRHKIEELQEAKTKALLGIAT